MIHDLNNFMFANDDLKKKLEQNNIKKLKDLLNYKPKKYEDFFLSDIAQIKESKKTVILCGIIQNKPKIFQKKILRMHFKILLNSENIIEVIVFNRLYLLDILKIDKKILVKGIYDVNQKNIIATLITDNLKIQNTIQPIYHLKKIEDKIITKIIKYIFKQKIELIPETLPEIIIKKYNFMSKKEALQNLHIPTDKKKLQLALTRLKYEEAFLIHQKWFNYQKKIPPKQPIKCNINLIKQEIKKIPFELTETQKKTINEIYQNLQQNYPTQRLIQGDVGSGKTIIAFIAALGVITANKQVLMIAPTAILANQHYENFIKIFFNIKTVLLTSKQKNKKELQYKIKKNQIQMIIGTHILANTDFFDLGLIIIDEQHKFGLNLKNQLIQKNPTTDIIYMTATPIPKTLIASYLENIHTSVIKKKDIFNNKIITKIITPSQILKILKINQNNDQQTYIVAPAITDYKNFFSLNAIQNYLQKANIKNLYILHGKQKKQIQDVLIKNFIQNKKGILLATTIIEIGIDVNNVNTIIIFGANYFGLNQLHQLRGRVGRSNQQGYCFLITDKTNERLQILMKETDGFKLSDYDLIKRGPGKFFSFQQSGYFKNNFLNLPKDFKFLVQAKKDIKDYFTNKF